MEKITNIEELIADAKAEEEAKKAVQDDLTNALMKSFTANLNKGAEEKNNGGSVTISLSEYVELKQIESDFNRLFDAIVRSFELNYNHEDIRVDGDIVKDIFKALYPEEYEAEYQTLLEECEGSERKDS